MRPSRPACIAARPSCEEDQRSERRTLSSAILATPAFAQQQPGGPAGGLEEIIVTAEFRSSSVQDTPIAITAVNAEMLEARSQTNLFQITANAPNVSLRPANSSFGSALVAYIRGIGQTDFNPSVEPGIGVYVDDVYYSTITGNLLDLLDLDRVEVLRGPQGTLAGRNAIGGALKLFTRKPDGKDDINLSLTKGEFNRTDVKGAGGLTISDRGWTNNHIQWFVKKPVFKAIHCFFKIS